jgi:hypothetical protein
MLKLVVCVEAYDIYISLKRHRLKANKTKHRAHKTKEMSNMEPFKNRG